MPNAGHRRPSIKLAAIPLAIGAVVVIGGIALSLAVDKPGSSVPSAVQPQRLPGQRLAAVPAKGALRTIAALGEPPTNIVQALVVPEGSLVTSHENLDQSAGPFDRSITLTVSAPPSEVLSFFEAEMAHHHWSEIGRPPVGTSKNAADQLFYQLAGQDTYYWQVGLTLTPSVPTLTPALGGGNQSAPGTTLLLELNQAQDPA